MKNKKLIYKIFVFFTIIVLILLTVAPVFTYLNRQPVESQIVQEVKPEQTTESNKPLDLQVESVQTDTGTLDLGTKDTDTAQ